MWRFGALFCAFLSAKVARRRSEILGPLVDIPTRRIAQRLVELRLRAINQGVYRPKTILTFRQFVETQLQPSIFPTFKRSTSRGYTYLLRKYLFPYFGDHNLTEINRQMVQAFVTQLARSSPRRWNGDTYKRIPLLTFEFPHSSSNENERL